MSKEVVIDEFILEDIPLSCTWIIVGAPGSGKCLAPGTPVIMLDGAIKNVEDVKTGDFLLGDDFSSRSVLSTTTGKDYMYKIKQSNGEDYVVNEPHILVLKSETGSELEISVSEILENPEILEDYKGYRLDPQTQQVCSTSNIEIECLGIGTYYGFQISGNGRFLLGDYTVTHNTTLMENLCYYLKHRYPVGRIFIGTESGYKHFSNIFHPLYVSNYYDETQEKSHILRQRTCVLENGKEYPGNFAINILDDVSDDPKIYRTKVMNGLFKLGSQHWNQLFMVGSQYAIDMPPPIRKATSFVAIFREPEEIERKKLYQNFGGLAGSFQNFCDLLDQLTGDYTCLIFKKRSQSNKLEDCIFWYTTKVLSPWKFGCKEYKKWAKDRYNTNYVEQLLM